MRVKYKILIFFFFKVIIGKNKLILPWIDQDFNSSCIRVLYTNKVGMLIRWHLIQRPT